MYSDEIGVTVISLTSKTVLFVVRSFEISHLATLKQVIRSISKLLDQSLLILSITLTKMTTI